jgi:hypothetical protein
VNWLSDSAYMHTGFTLIRYTQIQPSSPTLEACDNCACPLAIGSLILRIATPWWYRPYYAQSTAFNFLALVRACAKSAAYFNSVHESHSHLSHRVPEMFTTRGDKSFYSSTRVLDIAFVPNIFHPDLYLPIYPYWKLTPLARMTPASFNIHLPRGQVDHYSRV